MVQHPSKTLSETNTKNMQSSAKTKKSNDLTLEEMADKEYLSSKEKPKHFKNIKLRFRKQLDCGNLTEKANSKNNTNC